MSALKPFCVLDSIWDTSQNCREERCTVAIYLPPRGQAMLDADEWD
jgi:hypothetical protein